MSSISGLEGEKLKLDEHGVYVHPQFRPVFSLAQLPRISEQSYPNPTQPALLFEGMNVSIAVSSGAHVLEVFYFSEWLTKFGANVEFSCPAWVPLYKNGEVYLFSDPPTIPTHVVKCSVGFDEVLSGLSPTDALIIPGGLFSTGGVLRNDLQLLDSIASFVSQKKLVIFTGTGAQVFIAAQIAPSIRVPAIPYVIQDFANAGYFVDESARATAPGDLSPIVVAMKPSDIYSVDIYVPPQR